MPCPIPERASYTAEVCHGFFTDILREIEDYAVFLDAAQQAGKSAAVIKKSLKEQLIDFRREHTEIDVSAFKLLLVVPSPVCSSANYVSILLCCTYCTASCSASQRPAAVRELTVPKSHACQWELRLLWRWLGLRALSVCLLLSERRMHA